MDPLRRARFNTAFTPELFADFLGRLERRLGPIPFRVAETPLFLTPTLRDTLARQAQTLVAQLSEPTLLAKLKQAIPARYDAPGMDALPNCVQVDFALTEGKDGALEGKVVELQAFPSLYALMTLKAEAWAQTLSSVAGLQEDWSCFIGQSHQQGMDLLRRTLLGGREPSEVVLVDHEPQHQKTSPDFVATQQLFGVDAVCLSELEKEGHRLFRRKDGRRLQVHRIYNRMVFDELEVKKVKVPFDWTEPLELTWCSHPNWYWVWSKYALPFLTHPALPQARFLSELKELPQDLSRYVLKPLFSFAGAGVVIDVTPEVIAQIPPEQRSGWVLQEKIEYASVLHMPEGPGVKAEVRVMLARPPEDAQLTPLLCLVRFSRGKMLGVDFNKGLTWVGGSVGMWPRDKGHIAFS